MPSDDKLHSFSIVDLFFLPALCISQSLLHSLPSLPVPPPSLFLLLLSLFFFMRTILYVLLLSPSVPEIQLKNSKGLSNEKINELKSRLAEVAKECCGEVRTFHTFEKCTLVLYSSKRMYL